MKSVCTIVRRTWTAVKSGFTIVRRTLYYCEVCLHYCEEDLDHCDVSMCGLEGGGGLGPKILYFMNIPFFLLFGDH